MDMELTTYRRAVSSRVIGIREELKEKPNIFVRIGKNMEFMKENLNMVDFMVLVLTIFQKIASKIIIKANSSITKWMGRELCNIRMEQSL